MADPSFYIELKSLLNKWNRESYSGTPDYVLANYILSCLCAFDLSVKDRDVFHGFQVNDSNVMIGPDKGDK